MAELNHCMSCYHAFSQFKANIVTGSMLCKNVLHAVVQTLSGPVVLRPSKLHLGVHLIMDVFVIEIKFDKLMKIICCIMLKSGAFLWQAPNCTLLNQNKTISVGM